MEGEGGVDRVRESIKKNDGHQKKKRKKERGKNPHGSSQCHSWG